MKKADNILLYGGYKNKHHDQSDIQKIASAIRTSADQNSKPILTLDEIVKKTGLTKKQAEDAIKNNNKLVMPWKNGFTNVVFVKYPENTNHIKA